MSLHAPPPARSSVRRPAARPRRRVVAAATRPRAATGSRRPLRDLVPRGEERRAARRPRAADALDRHDGRAPVPDQRRAEHAAHLRNRRGRAQSEEHTSELQSRLHLVCRLLLEKKKKKKQTK